MQFFATSVNIDLGSLRLRFSIGLDQREPDAPAVRVEDLPRLSLPTRN